MKMISEFTDHDHIEGQFLLGSVSKGVNATGGSYFSVELRDASGQITAKKWDATLDDEQIYVTGNVINVIGDTNKYRDALQLKILSASVVPLEEIDVDRFVKAPPISKEELINKFNNYVKSIKNEDCQKLLKYMINKFDDKLYNYPAAVSIHHEYSSGLLVHSLTMADIAAMLCPIYDADYDLVITGCLLHDMGKIIELEGPIVYKYSLEGKLLGHISIMCAEIRKAAEELKITSEVPVLLEHMVLSHHGQQEFGSPVMPLTKEALLLSLIDNLDSKMVVVSKATEDLEPGSFSTKVFPLDNRSFYKPKK
ncbi:MAG: HD domain-containing protein [Bacilli bacterium]|nr:HD domain-containing protein [Bacilli bacterium]